MNEFVMTPNLVLAKVIKDRNISKNELSSLTGLEMTTIDKLLTGSKQFSMMTSVDIGFALDIELCFFLELQIAFNNR